MRLRSRRPGPAVLLLAAALVLAGQQDERPTFRAETRLVLLHATVADKSGKLITDLPREAFRVFEDGVEQKLRIFRREDIPVSLGLIVDNSGSMRDKRKKVESASLQLVKASNPEDEVFIVNFNDEAYLDVSFTSDIKKMEELGLSRIDARGGTAMRDAIVMSLDHLKEKAKKDKKVLLVVTDGDDTASTVTLEKCLQRVHESEVLVYAIGILGADEPRTTRRARRALEAITKASGGMVYFPKEAEEVETIARQVAHEIRNQYVLAYTPLKPDDGAYRQIRVAVRGSGSPMARTRSGYYAGAPKGGTPAPVSALPKR